MKIRWVILLLPVLSVVAISLVVQEHAAHAARAQSGADSAASPVPTNASPPGTLAIPDTTLAINSDKPMSERIVHYEIDAKYDATKHTVDATEVLTYHNLTGQALDHFPFPSLSECVSAEGHVGARGQTRWAAATPAMRSGKTRTTARKRSRAWKWWAGRFDRAAALHRARRRQQRRQDRGRSALAKPIAPGEYVQFKIAFQTKFPETQARSGWKRDFVLGGQWFPKVGVWWHGAWNCHQYHDTTEFFADFGVYDVKLTVPQFEVVGASGVKVSESNNADNTKTLTYHGDDIHDFAWTASPRYKVKDDGIFQGQMGPVQDAHSHAAGALEPGGAARKNPARDPRPL